MLSARDTHTDRSLCLQGGVSHQTYWARAASGVRSRRTVQRLKTQTASTMNGVGTTGFGQKQEPKKIQHWHQTDRSIIRGWSEWAVLFLVLVRFLRIPRLVRCYMPCNRRTISDVCASNGILSRRAELLRVRQVNCWIDWRAVSSRPVATACVVAFDYYWTCVHQSNQGE